MTLRSIITVIFSLSVLTGIGQSKSKSKIPSNSRVARSQMNEALKEKDALSKDDPESAKMLKNMMKGMHQSNEPVKTAENNTVYKSSVKKIKVSTPFAIPDKASAKDRLLWFKGKKLKSNLLVTVKGTLVELNPNQNLLTIQPKKEKDPFDKIDKELSKTEQRKNELIKQIASVRNSVFFYPALVLTLKQYDLIASDYKNVIKNTFTIPSIGTVSSATKVNTGGVKSKLIIDLNDEIPENVKAQYNNVINRMENPPSLDFLPPPSHEFDACYTCNESKQKDYENKKEKWFEESFWKYEVELIKAAMTVSKSLIPFNNVESVKMNDDMDSVFRFSIKRMGLKLDKLTQEYSNDYTLVPVIIETTLAFERQKQLIGIDEEDDYSARMGKISDMLNGFDGYIQHQMDLKNYNFVFNLPVIIGMESQKQLVGTDENGGMEFFQKLEAFNRFKMHVELKFNFETDDLKANGTIASSHDTYVGLGLLNCKYQLYIKDADYGSSNTPEKEFRLPLVINGGTKQVKEKENWVSYSYSGPKSMFEVFPPFHISFCDEGEDSAYIEIVNYYPEDLQNINAKAVQFGYNIDFMAYANMLIMNNPKELANKTADAKAIGTEMMKLMAPQITDPTGNTDLDHLQDYYNKISQNQKLQFQMADIMMQNKLLILFDARNNDGQLINAEKQINQTVGDKGNISGVVTIKVVHDPAPYDALPSRKPLHK